MEYKIIGKKIILRLDEGEEMIASITAVCEKEGITSAVVSGIGFTTEMKVRIYDKEKDEFLFQDITGSMEITSLVGNVLQTPTGMFTHLHIMAADKSMLIRGGHLVRCKIGATGEIVIESLDGKVVRGESDDFHLGTMHFCPDR